MISSSTRLIISGLIITASCLTNPLHAQNPPSSTQTHTLSYTNGYVIGKNLAQYYQGPEQQAFIKGLMLGLGVQQGAPLSDEEIKNQKSAWLKQTDLSLEDKVSYMSGYLIGAKQPAEQPKLNPLAIAQGIFDALATQNQPFVDAEMASKDINKYSLQNRTEQRKLIAEISVKNDAAGQAFLAENAKKPGVVVLSSGLQYKIIQPGNGAKPSENDFVTLSIVGQKIDGSVFYDSKAPGNKPINIRINATLDGWKQALLQMQTGSIWELYIPGALAYGRVGWQDKVMPGETLIYKINLLSIQSKKPA